LRVLNRHLQHLISSGVHQRCRGINVGELAGWRGAFIAAACSAGGALARNFFGIRQVLNPTGNSARSFRRIARERQGWEIIREEFSVKET
jgi:hypothetical protein